MFNIRYFFLLLIVLSIIFFSGCGNKSKLEDEMRLVLHKAKELEEDDKLKEAYVEYQKIVPLNQKDPALFTFLKIDEILTKRGWSYKSLDMSYTLKLMAKLQNKVNAYIKMTNGELPDLEDPNFIYEDAWGRRILIEKRISFKHRKLYDFTIKSYGKDGKWDTFDDLMFINKAFDKYVPKQKEKEKKKEVVQKKKLGEKSFDINDLIKSKKTKSK